MHVHPPLPSHTHSLVACVLQKEGEIVVLRQQIDDQERIFKTKFDAQREELEVSDNYVHSDTSMMKVFMCTSCIPYVLPFYISHPRFFSRDPLMMRIYSPTLTCTSSTPTYIHRSNVQNWPRQKGSS